MLGEVTLPEAFTRTARRMGDREAVTDTATTLSYAALDARSDRLAAVLTTTGVGPGDRIGLYAGRTVELVVGILGILKTGAAYVPLDPTYPVERLRFLAADAQLAAIVADGTTPPTELGDQPVVHTDESVPPAGGCPPGRVVGPTDLAYLMYTSDSNGMP
jgi:non-ribosomal peptide synthetase component F